MSLAWGIDIVATKRGRPKKAKSLKKVTLAQSANADFERAIVKVDDPYSPGAKLDVTKNIRVHPLDTMLANGRLENPKEDRRPHALGAAARYEAGQRFLELIEKAQIGNVQAIDYSRVKVDVSYVHRGLDDSVIAATNELTMIRSHVGTRPYSLLRAVIGERRGANAIAVANPNGSMVRQIWHINQCIRDALDDLIDFYGVAHGAPSRRIRDVFDDLAARVLAQSGTASI